MISKGNTPAIMQEAFRRTPSYKTARPDGVPGLVFKHMLPSFRDAFHHLFQSMAITGITPLMAKKHAILLYKREIPREWYALSH
jgi:hypothetical protein